MVKAVIFVVRMEMLVGVDLLIISTFLSCQVTKREEYIQKLKQQNTKLEEDYQQLVEIVCYLLFYSNWHTENN